MSERLYSLQSLRQRAEDGHADLADETSCIVGGDELAALLAVAEAAGDVVWNLDSKGVIRVVSGFDRLREAVARFA